MTGLEAGRPDVPKLSLAERDRRWAAVRAMMERERLDVLVAPQHSGAWEQLQAAVRYLVGIGGQCAPAAVVLPLDGEVTR